MQSVDAFRICFTLPYGSLARKQKTKTQPKNLSPKPISQEHSQQVCLGDDACNFLFLKLKPLSKSARLDINANRASSLICGKASSMISSVGNLDIASESFSAKVYRRIAFSNMLSTECLPSKAGISE